ncbi:MAG: hypothetical protein IJA15_00710, partial [Clostridia bacterium]|nr:hypothetical protein [Clostridia bacterium]
MKKNKSLRLASVLLMLCLITTCAVSGTFAKYTTSATATENARVAKWGIEMEAGASAFSDTYNADKVKSNGDKVVAPNSNGSNTYEVSGTPEVAYEITFDYDDLQEVYLNAGTYNYSGTNVTYESKEVTENVPATGKYYPIKYTVTLKSTNASAKYVQVDALVDEYISDASAKPFNTLKDALDAVKNTKIV